MSFPVGIQLAVLAAPRRSPLRSGPGWPIC